jgi:hypothetical protein
VRSDRADPLAITRFEAGPPRPRVAGRCAVALLLLASLLAGCSEEAAPPPPAPSSAERRELAAQALVDLEQAVAGRDPAAAEKLAPPGNEEAAAWARGVADNARALRVRDFGLRYVDEDLAASGELPDGHWAAAVEATWRFAGFDRGTATTEVGLVLAQDDAGVHLVGMLPPEAVAGSGRRTPPWLAGPVHVHRDDELLVLVDGSEADLADWTRLARRALPTVRSVLTDWTDGLVVEVPGSSVAVDAALGEPAGEYAGIAAVTSSIDGTHAPGSPVHVFVNPEVAGALEPIGAQIVMTHEVTHLAADAVRAQTPLWLLEGFADYVALRDTDLPVSRSAGQILAQVREDGAPQDLPGPHEFDTQDGHLGATYEAAWLACRLLARVGGEDALVTLYRRASAGEDVDTVLRELYGFGEEEFTRRWRAELEQLATTTG